jgi:pimeloyl-ACP methyl ester carboxylesterase
MLNQMASSNAAGAATIVLVHGAFADSSSWNGVVSRLLAQGYPVVAAPNPLRGLKTDSDSVASVLKSIQGPVVLVGHSYGGSVITSAAGDDNVVALVYVAGLAPDEGETAGGLTDRFPGSTLGSALAPPVALPDGGQDIYIQQERRAARPHAGWARVTGSSPVSADPRARAPVRASGANAVLVIVVPPRTNLAPVGYVPVCGMAGAPSWTSLGLSTGLRSMSFHVVPPSCYSPPPREGACRIVRRATTLPTGVPAMRVADDRSRLAVEGASACHLPTTRPARASAGSSCGCAVGPG